MSLLLNLWLRNVCVSVVCQLFIANNEFGQSVLHICILIRENWRLEERTIHQKYKQWWLQFLGFFLSLIGMKPTDIYNCDIGWHHTTFTLNASGIAKLNTFWILVARLLLILSMIWVIYVVICNSICFFICALRKRYIYFCCCCKF